MCTATCTPLNRSRSPVVSACAAVACARAALSTLVQDGKYSFSALPLLAKGSTAGEFSVAIIALVSCNVILVAMASCCVLFGDLDFGPVAFDDAPEAKRFLLGVLADAVRDAPDAEAYERQLGDDRAELRAWLAALARAVGDARAVDALLAAAAASESLLFAPDVAKKRKKRKYNKRR